MSDFRSGEYILATSGEYSDYFPNGLFKTLTNFNAEEEWEKWTVQIGKEPIWVKKFGNRWTKKFSPCPAVELSWKEKEEVLNFYTYLIEKEIIEEVHFRELHTNGNAFVTLDTYGEKYYNE